MSYEVIIWNLTNFQYSRGDIFRVDVDLRQ